MTTPITLKVRPKVFTKLEATKRMKILVSQKDMTWDEFLEDLINRALPFYVLELYNKMKGSEPKSTEEFLQGLYFIQGLLEGIGQTAEQIMDQLTDIADSLQKLKLTKSKSEMYT